MVTEGADGMADNGGAARDDAAGTGEVASDAKALRAPASDYDEFVDWEKRLAREAPLFERLFSKVGVRTVADVGAGSARHAIMFGTWGLDVTAVDPSESMLAQAEENLAVALDEVVAARGSVKLLRAGFGDLAPLGIAPVDAVVSTGNALPHVDGHAGLREALEDFSAVLRPGGVIVLHLLNHARLIAARVRSIPPVVRDTDEGTKVFLRVIGYPEGDEFLDFDFLTLLKDPAEEWAIVDRRRSQHAALPMELLEAELGQAGFEEIAPYGNHAGKPFERDQDESVIVVARRR